MTKRTQLAYFFQDPVKLNFKILKIILNNIKITALQIIIKKIERIIFTNLLNKLNLKENNLSSSRIYTPTRKLFTHSSYYKL